MDVPGDVEFFVGRFNYENAWHNLRFPLLARRNFLTFGVIKGVINYTIKDLSPNITEQELRNFVYYLHTDNGQVELVDPNHIIYTNSDLYVL